MSGFDRSPPIGKMSDIDMEKEILWRSLSGLLRAIRHFEGNKGLQSKEFKRKDAGGQFFVDSWAKKEFRNFISDLQKKYGGYPVPKGDQEKKPEEIGKAVFRK